MFVAASTRCFSNLPLEAAVQRLVDLEFTAVEIVLDEEGSQLKPSDVAKDIEQAIQVCRKTQRLTPVAYAVEIKADSEAEYYAQFDACCRLAKATKVNTIAVRSEELGTPFNAEIERLQELVRLAAKEGVVVGLVTESGRMTQDPATAVVFCNNVKGLCLTLDPSHYICGPHQGAPYEQVMEHVCHVRLRDTTKEKLQVRVGQGVIEYGRLITQLSRVNYTRTLCVDIAPMDDVDQMAEMRKIRLLLESLL